MSDREKERKHLIPKVKAMYRHTRGSYGTHRMSEELTADGNHVTVAKTVSSKTVANRREYHFRWTEFLFDKYNSFIVTIRQLLCIHYFNKQARVILSA